MRMIISASVMIRASEFPSGGLLMGRNCAADDCRR